MSQEIIENDAGLTYPTKHEMSKDIPCGWVLYRRENTPCNFRKDKCCLCCEDMIATQWEERLTILIETDSYEKAEEAMKKYGYPGGGQFSIVKKDTFLLLQKVRIYPSIKT